MKLSVTEKNLRWGENCASSNGRIQMLRHVTDPGTESHILRIPRDRGWLRATIKSHAKAFMPHIFIPNSIHQM